MQKIGLTIAFDLFGKHFIDEGGSDCVVANSEICGKHIGMIAYTLSDSDKTEQEVSSFYGLDDGYKKIVITMDDDPFVNLKNGYKKSTCLISYWMTAFWRDSKATEAKIN